MGLTSNKYTNSKLLFTDIVKLCLLFCVLLAEVCVKANIEELLLAHCNTLLFWPVELLYCVLTCPTLRTPDIFEPVELPAPSNQTLKGLLASYEVGNNDKLLTST